MVTTISEAFALIKNAGYEAHLTHFKEYSVRRMKGDQASFKLLFHPSQISQM